MKNNWYVKAVMNHLRPHVKRGNLKQLAEDVVQMITEDKPQNIIVNADFRIEFNLYLAKMGFEIETRTHKEAEFIGVHDSLRIRAKVGDKELLFLNSGKFSSYYPHYEDLFMKSTKELHDFLGSTSTKIQGNSHTYVITDDLK